MNTFPLIKVKWSNEHIMAALLLVLILYHIPRWNEKPGAIPGFLLLIAIGLLMDAAFNIIRYKRIWCCVSGAVTAAIISVLTPGVPLWEQMIGLASGLIFGKYIWGGTGKNRINPAMVGLLVILIFGSIPDVVFTSSYLLLIATILSLPFLKVRPFAGLGFIAGVLIALLFDHNFNLPNIISSGVFFWSCIILTDPVTVIRNRIFGLTAGLLGGFLIMFISPNTLSYVAVILSINVFSYVIDGTSNIKTLVKPRFNIPKIAVNMGKLIDLTGVENSEEEAELGVTELSAEEILRSIKYNEIFGMGGAAFPTYKKIKAVQASVNTKYLIINGVECDPGLIHDNYILIKLSEQVQKGIEILKSCIDFDSIHLAVKSTKGLNYNDEIIIHQVPDKYPAGAEKILIQEVLHLPVSNKQNPADCGILVLNVQTVYSIYRAIYLNKSIDSRFLTVADLKDRTARVVKVPLGMKLYDIMNAVYPGRKRVFAGGGIMQSHIASEEDVVDKNTNFIAAAALPKFKESPQCSRCGNCISHCPSGLAVNKIADLVDQGRLQETVKYNPMECINCGSCSYSCLAGRNLAVKIKAAKDVVINQKDE